MSSRHEIKNKVLKSAKKTAQKTVDTAKQGLDQVLLKLEHPAVQRMAERLASPETKDMLTRLSQRILDQADSVRESLVNTAMTKASGAMAKATDAVALANEAVTNVKKAAAKTSKSVSGKVPGILDDLEVRARSAKKTKKR